MLHILYGILKIQHIYIIFICIKTAIYGKQPWPAKVILVATHADKVECPKNNKGEYASTDADLILANAMQKFCMDFDIYQQVFVIDAHLAMANELKNIRNYMADVKSRIVQVCLYIVITDHLIDDFSPEMWTNSFMITCIE